MFIKNMVYPLTKKELYCGTTLKHLYSFYRNIVTRKGIKPISAGLGAAAQSLYQRAKNNTLKQLNKKIEKICEVQTFATFKGNPLLGTCAVL